MRKGNRDEDMYDQVIANSPSVSNHSGMAVSGRRRRTVHEQEEEEEDTGIDDPRPLTEEFR